MGVDYATGGVEVIYKYPLLVTDMQVLQLPMGAQLLSVIEQAGTLMLYALVDPTYAKSPRTILIVGTGNAEPYICSIDRFIGTVKQGPLVWHVWEKVR